MDKAFLEGCLANGMSLPEIGRLAGRPPGTVGYWVTKYELVANGREKFSPSVEPIDRELLGSLVADGLTLREIAEKLGEGISRVARAIEKNGLGPTGHGRRATAIRNARMVGAKEIELDCPKHGRTAYWIGATTIRCRKCNAAGVASRRRRVKQILIEEAGGCCVACGYSRSQAGLEFHHLDPTTKSFGLSQAGITRSIAASREEAKKCVLLCATCHAEVEVGDLTLPLD